MTGVKCIREQPAIGGPPRFVNRSLLKSKFRYIRGSGGWCACTHMSHVSTTSCSWCSSQSVVYALAHVTWTRNSVGSCAGTHRRAGAHAGKNRLAEGTYEGVLLARVGVRATETESAHSASPSVARTCSAMRLNSPLRRCCVRLRPILHSLTGWAGW